jgi:hypothetical protein
MSEQIVSKQIASKQLLVVVGLIVAAWVALAVPAPASRGGHVTADEPQYLLTAISLGEDRDLDIDDELDAERFRVFHNANLPVQTKVLDDGSQVSPHDPLLPVVLAGPTLVGGWVAAKLTLAVLAGILAAVLVWTAVRRFAVPTSVAVVGVLAFACTPPLAFYGTQVYPELPAALAVALAIAALTGPLGRRGVLLAASCVVALPWFSVKYAPVALALAACLLARRRSVAVIAGLGVMAGVFVAAHLAWYGGLTPYATGDHFVGGEFTATGSDPDYFGRSIRLAGLLLDRDFGLAAWQPAFLLAVPAAVALVTRRPRGWLVLGLPFVAGWLNATFVAFTMHGWWWPGRQTVVVLPCVVLAVTWWAARTQMVARVLVGLGAFGASVYACLVAQAVLGDLKLIVSFESVSHPLVRAWQWVLPDYRVLTARDWALHAVWLAAIAATVLRPRLSLVRPRIQGATTR